MRNQCLLFIFYFQLTIFLSVAETEFCKLSDSALSSCNKDVFKIEEWWREMSVQKPLKCETPKRWIRESPLLKLFSKQMPVVSVPCRPAQSPVKFSFKGKIEEGRLKGPGKLKLGRKVLEVNQDPICIKVNQILGQEPIEIIGTFVNGYLHGNAKILLSDGKVVLANYVDGLSDGFRREWNENGSLTFAGFYHKGARIGKAWQKVGESLVYDEVATIDRADDLTVVIPLQSNSVNSKIISGKYWPHIFTLHNFFRTKIVLIELEDHSCFLKIKTEIVNKGSDGDFFFDIKQDLMIEKYSEENKPLCQMHDKQEGNVSEKLVETFKTLNHDLPNLHQTLLKMKLESSDPKFGEKLISGVSFNNENASLDPWSSPSTFNLTFFEKENRKTFIGIAGFDAVGRFHGLAELTTSSDINLDQKFGFELKHVDTVRAVFNHGDVDGPVMVTTKDGRVSYLTIKNGILHGPAIFIGLVPILPSRLKRPVKQPIINPNSIGFIGRFSNGKPSRSFWLKMIGGGFIHGDFKDGEVTGDNLSFIYPDMETVFYGKFENFVMKSAHESEVLETKCDNDGMIVVSKFSKISGPEFYYDPPTNVSFGAGPPGVIDPYERKNVRLAQSSIPDSGEGVFAVKDLPANRCNSLYSGFMFDSGDEIDEYLVGCIYNMSLTLDERRLCKKYTLTSNRFHSDIDIPPEMDRPGIFHPTLGPKVNHHFRHPNSAYQEMEHPRWGPIMCVQNYLDVKAGDEILTYYAYVKGDPPEYFPWYFEAEEKLEEEERRLEDLEEKKTKKKKKRKKSSKKK